jgi:hydroxyacylglutathione hydrolase
MSDAVTTATRSVPPIAVVDEGLGNSCYLVDLGDGSALAVDPPRDLRRLRTAALQAGLRIRFAADTHLHADFLSAAMQLLHDDGVTVLASAAGRRSFDHRGLVDGDEVDLGGLTMTALATPGHTDEHLSYVLQDGGHPVGVFTGGSLIVGSAARTDLLGEERADELARAQFASLQRLVTLPPETAVWPTHGAGSFCSAPPGADRTSTIGHERATNPLLRVEDEDEFVRQFLSSLGSYPSYFRRLPEINRRGPALIQAEQTPGLAQLTADEVVRLRANGAVVVDARPISDYADGHVPSALSIPLRDQFATWLGWLVAPDAEVIVVRNSAQDVDDLVWQARNIGVDQFAGELAGGFGAWAESGHPITRTGLVGPAEIDADRRILDIRQDAEFASGHLPGAEHIELGSLTAVSHLVPDEPTLLMCGHGERAMAAAGLLEQVGLHDLTVLCGGPGDWEEATGRRLQAET